jgi:hypothetical protein
MMVIELFGRNYARDLIYGGSSGDSFTTYNAGNNNTSAYLNLELNLDVNISNPTNYLDKDILED